MARDLSTGNFLRESGTPISAYPFTLSIWAYADTASSDGALSGLFDASESNVWFFLRAVSGGAIRMSARNTTNFNVDTSANFPVGAWFHACGVFTDATTRRVYLDGGNDTGDANSVTFPTGLDRVTSGRIDDSSPGGVFDGKVSDHAIWDAALTGDEVSALASGLSPLAVRPGNLVRYWELTGNGSSEIDRVNQATMAHVGSPGSAESPYIIQPWMHNWSREAAAAGGSVAPQHYHHRHHNLAG